MSKKSMIADDTKRQRKYECIIERSYTIKLINMHEVSD